MGPLFEEVPVIGLMLLAETYRRVGDEDGARAATETAKHENAALRAEGEKTNNRDMAEAMIAAFEGNHDAAISALRAALANGMRVSIFDDPIFDDLRSHDGFVALAGEFDATVAQEHAKVLQLICYENPTPNAWRPLPETCEGVIEQPGLLEFSR